MNAAPGPACRRRTACHDPGMANEAQRSVLIVDDEPTIVEVVARYLERAGYTTRTAATGEQALAVAPTDRPDLGVLALMMPGTDGRRVMRRLADRASAPVGVIRLTARGEESDR